MYTSPNLQACLFKYMPDLLRNVCKTLIRIICYIALNTQPKKVHIWEIYHLLKEASNPFPTKNIPVQLQDIV